MREYIKLVAQFPPLTTELEKELLLMVAESNEHAREAMINHNLGLVISIAKKYRGRGIDDEDLIAEGVVGLIRAVEGYHSYFETKFSTFATYWIKQRIRKILNKSSGISISPVIYLLVIKTKQVTTRLTAELGRPPSKQEIIKAANLQTSQAKRVFKYISLNNCEEDAIYIASKEANSVEKDIITRALGVLSERERLYVMMNFGIDPYPEMTLEEIGDSCGITKQGISHHYVLAMQKLQIELEKFQV